MAQIMAVEEAVSIIKFYVCARCYGQLTADSAEGHNLAVHCANENCNGEGFVTRSYADRRKSEDLGDASEARHNLGKLLGITTPIRGEEKVLKELGF